MSHLPSYPYNQENKYSINFQFNNAQERIVYFDFMITPDDMLESIKLEFDLEQLEYELHYGYSMDTHNWSQFYRDFELFKEQVDEQVNDGFETFIRLKIIVNKEDERNYEKLSNNHNLLQISQILINGRRGRIDKIEVPFADNFVRKKATNNLWNPYNGMEKAVQNWKNTSMAINNVIGHYVWYFKVQPEQAKKSVTLKSYRIKNVSDLKKIKILVPDNDIPDNANIFSEYDIQFSDEMVMHILDEVFIDAFTREAGGPEQHDFLYFPLTERMYEVSNAYPVKEFMNKYVKWQVNLVKYERTEMVQNMEGATEFEELANSFGESVNDWIDFNSKYDEQVESFEEIQKAQPDYYNTDVLEATRKALHKDLDIVQWPMYKGGTRLFQNWYRMSMVPKGDMAVTYKARDQKPTNISISFWMMQETAAKKPLFKAFSDLKNEWLVCTYQNGKIVVSVGSQILLETSKIVIESKKAYNICINWSNQFGFASLIVMEYNEAKRTIGMTEYVQTNINTYNELLHSIEIYGGQLLLSAMTVRKRTVDEASAQTILLTTQPDSEDVIFHDKCDTVGSEIRTRL